MTTSIKQQLVSLTKPLGHRVGKLVGLRSSSPRCHIAYTKQLAIDSPDQASYREVIPARKVPLWVDKDTSALPFNLDDPAVWEYPAAFVAHLKHAHIVAHGIASKGDRLIGDLSVEGGVRAEAVANHSLLRRESISRYEFLPGSSVGVINAYSPNYYHWMLEVVPRIELVKRHAEKEYNEAKRIILNSTKSNYHQEVLNYLGLTERVLTTNDASFIAEELITPSLAGIMINPPPWACSYVREALIGMADNAGEFASPYGRRIYVSRNRGKIRRVIQEERIIEVLTSYGFTVVYPEYLSVAQQIKMFSEAEAVVSPHGAALTNTIFCSPGTRVIELFSPGYNPPCYWIAAAHCGLEYRCIIGEPLPSPVSGSQSSNSDILLDENKLRDTLQSLRMG